MGAIKHPHRVKLIVGLIYQDDAWAEEALKRLVRRFGTTDYTSQALAFDYTDYYAQEFGTRLQRKFVSFKKLIPPEKLAAIKNTTNAIESALSHKGKRRVNIDPGYLDLAKVILATTKDFAHRVYLGKGVYAENTLVFRNKCFTHYEWTYPDYRTPHYLRIFHAIRELYVKSCLP